MNMIYMKKAIWAILIPHPSSTDYWTSYFIILLFLEIICEAIKQLLEY